MRTAANLDVVVDKVVEALLQAREDEVDGAHPELDQLPQEPHVLRREKAREKEEDYKEEAR